MSRLTPLQKEFVVQSLAQFSTLSQVCEQLKEQFGVTASTAQIARYKPDSIAGAGLSRPLRDVFDVARRNYLSDHENAPMFHLGYRLRKLQYLLDRTEDATIILRCLEQAAKECGGMYIRAGASNSAAPGATSAGASVEPLTEEERYERLMVILNRAYARREAEIAKRGARREDDAETDPIASHIEAMGKLRVA